MRASFSAALAAWGQEVKRELPGQETETWRAFVQPILRQEKDGERVRTPLGEVDERQWLYIGPADISLQRGETLFQDGKRYVVRESWTVYAGTKPFYRRALLRRGKEAAT